MEFTERMELARNNAALRRHRGLHTGAMAAGWEWKRQDPEKGSFERFRQETLAKWGCEAGSAKEQYLRAVFPERYDDVTLEQVVAARIDAELDAIPF